jgi:CheY-like chemotaxis protein
VARRIRVVVGEGRTAQRGLLRFVLEGEGFDVVGEAAGSADLSGVIEQQRPDVVVLDDGIGVMAVPMVHEVAPDTKIVLVWPAAVVPIGGDARVEPAKILKDLGPAVQHVAAAAVGLAQPLQQPEWIARVRKDPATLRAKLVGTAAAAAAAAAARPSVTRLQRGTRRLHPIPRRSKTTGQEPREEAIPVPLVVLPAGDGGAELEPVLDIGGAGAIGTGVSEGPVEERSEWNRRLGMLALSGAAAVSALVLALALGGGRVSVTVIRGGGTLPPGAIGFDRPGSSFDGPFGTGSLGGSGFEPIPVVDEPASRPDQGGGGKVIVGTGGGFAGGGIGGDLARPGTSGGSDAPTTGGEPGDGGVGTGNDGGDDGGGVIGGGGSGGGVNGGGWTKGTGGLPGTSAEHNPHGGPPGKTGQTPANGQDHGSSAAHSQAQHSHKH